jgi:hypothetical protein
LPYEEDILAAWEPKRKELQQAFNDLLDTLPAPLGTKVI